VGNKALFRVQVSAACADECRVDASYALEPTPSSAGLIARLRAALPQGRTLSDANWVRRHRAIGGLLWVHVVALPLVALGWGAPVGHSLFEGAIIVPFAIAGSLTARDATRRRLGACAVSLGLLTASATLVHISGGMIEAHFHFFVMMTVLVLYEDWLPYLLAFAYVVAEHGLAGAIQPDAVYNHAGGQEHPWRWALVHGFFIVGAGVANVTSWRFNEQARAEARAARGLARASEERLWRERELSDRLVRSSPDGILAMDVDRRYTVWNDAMERMSGLSSEEVLGRRGPEIFGFLAESDDDLMQAALAGKEVVGTERPYSIPATGRTGVFDAVYSPLRGQDGKIEGALAIVRDTSDRRQLEAQLRQSQKMEAVGQLAGGVAHDFNNLITAISGYADLALEEAHGHDLIEDLTEIKSAAERAASLTQQLLAFSRRQILNPTVLDLNAVVREFASMMERLLGSEISLVTELEPRLGTVRADRVQIEQVLMNLTVNARDAMPGGGSITISTANVSLDEAWTADHPGSRAGSYVVLTVSDTGGGMDASIQAHAFEPFFTTKEAGKGTGLGLATVYGIVKQSEGYVVLASEAGHGTVCEIYLPRTADVVERKQAARGGEAPQQGSETILLVEDEESVRRLARQVLRRSGYRVLSASDPEAALKLAADHDGELDLLITDLVMPKMHGVQLAEEVTRLRPGTKVLYTSGYTSEATARRDVLEKGSAFLPKPFTVQSLEQTARAILDG
jgi:PAS domain S-box-containing protein